MSASAIIGLVLKSAIPTPLVIAAVAALAFGGVSQCSRASKAEGKIATAERKAEKSEKARKVAVADYGQCKKNREDMEATINAKNAEIDRQKAESDKRSADLTKARKTAEKEAQRADKAASKLASFKPTGSDVCARLLAVDEVVKGAN